MRRINILGVQVDKVDMREAVAQAAAFLEGDSIKVIYTPNPEIIIKTLTNDRLRQIINSGDLLIPDGVGIVQAAKTLKTPVKERVTGFDLAEALMAYAAAHNKRIFFFGAAKGVVRKAAAKMTKKYPGLCICGGHSGYFQEQDSERIIERINRSGADILLVGLGAPKQEEWIDRYKDQLQVKLVMGIGGSFDGYAGNFPRAPQFMIDRDIEWLYRLIKQPSRVKRMSVLPVFKVRVWLSRFAKGKR